MYLIIYVFYYNNYVFINNYSLIFVSTYLLSTKSFNYVILSDNLNILLLDGAFILNDDLSDDVKI